MCDNLDVDTIQLELSVTTSILFVYLAATDLPL